MPPFEAGRIQLELGLAKKDAKQVGAAKENLMSAALPLVQRELKRAEEWLAAK